MQSLGYIRKYFKPIQPHVTPNEENIVYREFEPISQLQNYIHCYWQLKTKEPLRFPFHYRVVSDGCIDIFFSLKNTQESFVMGFCNKYTEFSIGKEFDYGGIRFYPAIFPSIFGVSAKSLANKDQFLKYLLPDLAEFISTHIKDNFSRSLPKIDTLFHALIQQKTIELDDRFYRAFLEILKRKGNLETEKELNTGLSARQLRRWFHFYIGTAPKSFSQVIRFQYILNAKAAAQGSEENKIFFDVGFFDQAHFIKNFTKFYGVTPSKAFR